MHIGIAGPVSTQLLTNFLDTVDNTAPTGLGGINVTQLVLGLLADGHQISVFSLDHSVTKPVVLRGRDLAVYYGPYRTQHRMRDLMAKERHSLSNFITSAQPDIVNAHWTYEFAWAAIDGAGPTLITVHDWAPAIFRLTPDAYRLARFLMNFVSMVRGRFFSAVSPYIQGKLRRYWRIDAPVTPNAINEDAFLAGEKIQRSQSPIIISVNNGFGKLKNVGTLLVAFALIRRECPTSKLILLGTGFEEGGEAHAWAHTQGLSTDVVFVGHRSNPETLKAIREADVMIHPSLEESFGMTVLEAMTQKTPVIGGDGSGAVPWVLDFGKAGILTNVRSPEMIATEAIRLLRDKDLWRYYSLAGYKRARSTFGLAAVVKQYTQIYEGVLAAHSTANQRKRS